MGTTSSLLRGGGWWNEDDVYRVPSDQPPVDPARIQRARLELDRALGPSKLLFSSESCERFATDESEADGRVPEIVVLAQDPEDVRATLEVASRCRVPVTPRAAGTGRTGGAVPLCGGIVLVTLGMKQIKEVDVADQVAVVEPGVVLRDLHAAVEAEGLFYPPDPNSLDQCAIGGNIAENAGGPRVVKYGSTRDYVLGLDLCLMGGQSLRTGRRTVKGVAGYDVTSLVVGSEGTLGVVTEATLRLIPKPALVQTALAYFAHTRAAAEAVQRMARCAVVPRCAELVDAAALQAIRSQGVGIDTRAGAMLLVEVDGDEQGCDRDLQRVGDACNDAGAVQVLVAQDASQRDRLWAARRELSPAIRRLARNKLAEDVVVPRSKIGDLVGMVESISARLGVRMLTYGHAGDGNLHVNFLWDDEDSEPSVQLAMDELMRGVLSLRGTITGEHGVGVLKRKYLAWEQSAGLIDLQRGLKMRFDPEGLLNPGKVFP
jgi:glycolate oxidase